MPISDGGARALPPLAALLLAACGPADPQPAAAEAAVQGQVACRVDGATTFSTVCGVERATAGDGLVLTLRHPGGGFRRLAVAEDGRGVIAADGAEPARVTLIGTDAIEVVIGRYAYRLPATVKPAA